MKQTKRFQKLAVLLFTAVLTAFSVSAPALASVPERPENQYVLDSANVIEAETEKRIVSENEKLFKETGAQIVIAAVDFLGGEDIEDYTYEMFNSWGVGSSERNNGILLVLAIGEDNYYAQAGYGIDAYFDGGKLQGLLDDYLEEDFAAGDYDAGVGKFFDAVYDEVESYYQSQPDGYTQQDGYEYEEAYPERNKSQILGSLVFVLFRIVIAVIVLIVCLALFRTIFGGRRGGPPSGGGGGGGFWTGMLLGSLFNSRRNRWRGPPPPGPGGFGGPRPPRGGGGFGGFGGFTGGGGARGGFGGGRSGGGGFHSGGGSHGGGAGRR